tara:strand:+ start:586 stop:963 length:378 start_codon:yes stop_codon:yes gene_type:complete
MKSFQKVVLSISIIILIISLIILGLFLAKSLFENSFPPIISDCPDYWDIVTDDTVGSTKHMCKDNNNINEASRTNDDDCKSKKIDMFSLSGTDKESELCEKYKWSTKCGVVWDGVTNNNKACESI